MQRKIKFRAWRSETQSMLTGQGLKDHIVAMNVGGTLELLHDKDIELMQYTGLKDKNGKEIYEGDILRGHTQIGYIDFKPIEWEQSKLRYYAYPQGRADRDWFERVGSFEVIGNIYENPELLEARP